MIGALVSLVVQALKSKFGGGWKTLAILAIVSLVAASLYTALVAVGYWQVVASVLVTAGAFYAFVIQRFEGSSAPSAPVNLPS
jgi:hypothetical protein